MHDAGEPSGGGGDHGGGVLAAGLAGEALDRAGDGDGGDDAATAIMTTDTVAKEAAHTDDAGWCIGGMTKGAGMIAPSMATSRTGSTSRVPRLGSRVRASPPRPSSSAMTARNSAAKSSDSA